MEQYLSIIRAFVKINRSASKWLLKKFPSIFSEQPFKEHLKNKIQSSILLDKPNIILEVGGVDRPLLRKSPVYVFMGLDIEERPGCSYLYDKFVVQSIEHPISYPADMIISMTLLEHVPNNEASVKSMFAGLSQNGTTHHYIPSGLHPYSMCLRLVGPKIQKKLIPILRPGAENVTGYPTFFDHCTPRAMERLFGNVGFTEIKVKTFYSANDYFAFFTPAYILVSLFEKICSALRLRLFASGFIISARKPRQVAINGSTHDRAPEAASVLDPS